MSLVEVTSSSSSSSLLLKLPAEILLAILKYTTPTSNADIPQLLTFAHTCTRLRALVLIHFFSLSPSSADATPGLASLLRAHAITHAWATGQLGPKPSQSKEAVLQLAASNINLPNAVGPRAQPVRPIVLRLPSIKPCAQSLRRDVHLLILFRAQALYWASDGPRHPADNEEARWIPEAPTPLHVLGRPSAAPPSSGTKRKNAVPAQSSSTRADSYSSTGRIANLSLDPTSLTGADNAWQDITAAVVLPLGPARAEGDETEKPRPVHLMLGRRDGTLQLATLRPPSSGLTTAQAGSIAGHGIGGTFELHPVLPHRFSNDIQALDVVPLRSAPSSSESSACLLAAGTKGGYIALLRISTPRNSAQSIPNLADDLQMLSMGQARIDKDESATHAHGAREKGAGKHPGASSESSQPGAPSKSQQRRARRKRAQQRHGGTSSSSQQQQQNQGDKASPADVQGQEARRHGAPGSSAADASPFEIELLNHRYLAADHGGLDSRSVQAGGEQAAGSKTQAARPLTVWTVRFVIRGSGGGGAGEGPERWLAVGSAGTRPLLLYEICAEGLQADRGSKGPAHPQRTRLKLASKPICLPHPRHLRQATASDDGTASNDAVPNTLPPPEVPAAIVGSIDGSVPITTTATAEPAAAAPSSDAARRTPALSKTSIFALWTIALPTPPFGPRAAHSSSSIRANASLGTPKYPPGIRHLLIAGYYDGTIAIFGCLSSSPAAPSGDNVPAPAGLQLLMQLRDPATQDAVYSLRAFWHLPTTTTSTLVARNPNTTNPSSSTSGRPTGQEDDAERRDEDGEPVLRVLAGSARFGCVRVYEVPLGVILAAAAAVVGKGEGGTPTDQDGSAQQGHHGYTGLTLFPSSASQTSVRRRIRKKLVLHNSNNGRDETGRGRVERSVDGGEDADATGQASAIPPLSSSSYLLPSASDPAGSRGPSSFKAGPTFELALDGDGNGDEADEEDGGGGWQRQGATNANAGGRVWGSNERGVWMLNFVPSMNPAARRYGAEVVEEHQVKQVAWYAHEGLHMDLRLSVDPWR
ncbi:hypothetical protein V8E36_003479 [Tilletia maclaganii]